MNNLPKIKLCLNTSQDDLVKELYEPCLKWAQKYDRGVGYFTSSWLAHNIVGMSDFISRGGEMRLITSPILSNLDQELISTAKTEQDIYKVFDIAMQNGVDELARKMEKETLNALSWMIYDGILSIKFAVPTKELATGMFHDKFGIFYNDDNVISFVGSMNETSNGFNNYESIKVFSTWGGTNDYVDEEVERFNRLWNNLDSKLKIYDISKAVSDKIFVLRTTDERPYDKKENKSKWKHQEKAVDVFLSKHNGILAMATGTGKTRTAIKIIEKLFSQKAIKRVIITMSGNDLLDQWAEQIKEKFFDKQVYLHYGEHKQLQRFGTMPDNAILLVSRDAGYLTKAFTRLQMNNAESINDTLIIFDEVHGAGSNSIAQALKGQVFKYRYRLGLSATPEREYDEVGNDFIEQEIGPVIFEFSLEDAIRQKILCGFNYFPLDYYLSEEEIERKRNIIRRFEYMKKNKEHFVESDMWTQLALVNKTAKSKLEIFKDFISNKQAMLKKCIVFVQTKEYGLEVQKILLDNKIEYHTYFAEDERENLEAFAKENIECLVTCQKISEGIDISSVTNIILFSSDRSRLVTTQRIGRALRIDKNNLNKRANVVDFILEDVNSKNPEETADVKRKEWLEKLSKVVANEE